MGRSRWKLFTGMSNRQLARHRSAVALLRRVDSLRDSTVGGWLLAL